MTSPVASCKAKIPETCRHHGLGKHLNDKDYFHVNERVQDSIKEMMKHFSSHSPEYIEFAVAKHTVFCWTRSMSAYDESLKTKPLPLLQNVSTEADELKNVAIGLFNEANILTAYKNGPFPIKAIQHAGKAKNLCAYTSLMFLKRFTDKDFQSDTPVEIIRRDALDSKKPGMFWHHAAIMTSYKGKKYVVDYTIRQFNPKLPIPWVGTVKEWEQTLTTANGETWGTTHLNKFMVQGGETRKEATSFKENF